MFSDDGRRPTWTQLRNRLMQKRMDRDQDQAAAAREKYGDLAEHSAFQYTKANTRRDMTSRN